MVVWLLLVTLRDTKKIEFWNFGVKSFPFRLLEKCMQVRSVRNDVVSALRSELRYHSETDI